MKERRVLLRRVFAWCLTSAGFSGSTSLGAGEPAPPRYAGRSLVEVVQELQAGGLKVVFSNELVRPEMRVRAEPTSHVPRQVLSEVLSPHGLRLQEGRAGGLIIVKAPAREASSDRIVSEERATPGGIEVAVRAGPTEAPMAGLVVRLLPKDTISTTDGQGRLLIPEVPPGLYVLEPYMEGFSIPLVDVAVVAGRLTQATLSATPAATESPVESSPKLSLVLIERSRLHETVLVSADALAGTPGPGPMAIRTREVMEVAGGAENVFRVVQTLPSVAGANEFQSRVAVRGGGPDQNLTILDGVEIHTPYRLEGLICAFNPETVKYFDLDPVPLHARYGDRLSSVLTVQSREGTRERSLAGSAAASLTDANVVLEGRLPKVAAGSWLLSGRRTYYDLVAERLVRGNNLPGFQDVQLKVAWEPFPRARFSLFALRSRESGDIRPEPVGAPGTEPREEEFAVFRAHNNVLGASLDWSPGPRLATTTSVSGYGNAETFDLQVIDSAEDDLRDFLRQTSVRDLAFREQVRFQASPRHVVEAGFDVHRIEGAWKMGAGGLQLPPFRRVGVTTWGDGLVAPVDSRLTTTRGAAWVQGHAEGPRRLAFDLGLRLEGNSFNRASPILPRARVTRYLGTSSSVWAGIGWFSQSPGYEKLLQSDYFLDLGAANPTSANERGRQAILGFGHELGRGLSLRVEGYHKRLDHLLVGRLETDEERARRLAKHEIPADFPASPLLERRPTTHPTNDGRGRAYGLEVLLQRRATSAGTRLTGWASYSFSRSERTAYGLTFPADQDRRHALSLVGNFQATPSFRLSATFQLASGFPFTPIQPDVEFNPDWGDWDQDGDRDEWRPLRWTDGSFVMGLGEGLLSLSQLNSRRLPTYARLDLRASYSPAWGGRRWEFYLDVINALNRKNTMAIDYEVAPGEAYGPSDLRLEERRVKSLPLIPSFGVRLRF